jgi:hypothetical protein
LVEDMQRVTMNGPMRLGDFFSSTVMCADRMLRVDGPPEPMIEAGALVAHLVRRQPGIGDGLLHGDIVVGRAVAHEPALALVDQRVEVDRRRAMNLAAKAVLGIVGREGNARAPLAQRSRNLRRVGSDRRHDADAGDDDAAHGRTPSCRAPPSGGADAIESVVRRPGRP